MTRTKATRLLEELYAQVPHIACQQKCQQCCDEGLISFGALEWDRMTERVGPTFPASGSRCSMLSDAGQCRAYDVRPMICRIWYTVEGQQCPHGCQPERRLTEKEAQALMGGMYELSGGKRAGPLVQIEEMLGAGGWQPRM